MNALQYMKEYGFTANSDLNYCTDEGIEYYIGYSPQYRWAMVVAIMPDDEIPDRFVIGKACLRSMAETAKTYGIDKVMLHTNYGVEVHSKEGLESVGLWRIQKITQWKD